MTLVTILLISFLLNFVLICSDETQSTTYVVLMDRSKMKALDASLGTSRSWHQEVIESIRVSSSDDEQPAPKLHYVYDQTIFGFSAKLTNHHLQTLKEMDGFLGSIEDNVIPLHTTHSPHFLGLEKGKGLWGSQNLASDVIIGVVDTGIWPEHPSFHDTGLSEVPSRWKGKCEKYGNFNSSSCNKKLIGAARFMKGYESNNVIINDTLSPRDSDGHGTHTASTAGGYFVSNANILGMANGTAADMRPTARVAVYKACFPTGCFGSDILAAIDQAVIDGVDVLSISLGGNPESYHNDAIAVAAFGAVQKGVVVSVSAGNSGPNSSTVSNCAPWLMTVAASTTDRDFLAEVQLGNGVKFSGTSITSGKPINNLPLIYNQTIGVNLCLSGSLSPEVVQGKIVICDRGISPRVSKGEEVKRAGGVAMILANVQENGNELNADAHVLPTVALGASAANFLRNYTKSSRNPLANIKFKGTINHKRAPVMAAFSSRGPNFVDPLILKPDMTAPGVNILAAYPPNISPTILESDKRRVLFNMMSGTSMSCPHVSGMIALLKSMHKDWSPAAIKSALMTTAYVLDSENSPISDTSDDMSPASPFAFGSGHVNVNKASDPGLIYDISTQDYLNYLCSSFKYNSSQIQLFSHNNKTCGDYSRLRPADLNYPSFSVIFDRKITGKKSITMYKRTVTNVGCSGVITYQVNVVEPEGVSITVEPKVLKFTTKRAKLSYYVSFKAKGIMPKTNNFSFGSLTWISGEKYSVRSSIAVIWK